MALACIPAICFSVLLLLPLGLLHTFRVPTGGMSPAVAPGDHLLAEGLTFLCRQPARGDIVVFKSDDIKSVPPETVYVKRVAGVPGERVRFADGKLSISDEPLSLSNERGKIDYRMPPHLATFARHTNLTIAPGQFYVLGDQATNSYDSRYWGTVPRENIIGRVAFCYWPPARFGLVK